MFSWESSENKGKQYCTGFNELLRKLCFVNHMKSWSITSEMWTFYYFEWLPFGSYSNNFFLSIFIESSINFKSLYGYWCDEDRC